MRRGHLVSTLALGMLLVAACADDSSDTTPPVGELCNQDTPLVNWVTFGHGFVTTYCQGCHASTAANRQGAPTNVVFDTEADTLMWKQQILTVAASDAPTMPPNGGPDEADRERLNVWLGCFAE
ncbi:MAG TPA: hypothetical protein ENK23_03120 [Sorangium sp.]|nr:hypothetical protein [Sorangium sp.]